MHYLEPRLDGPTLDFYYTLKARACSISVIFDPNPANPDLALTGLLNTALVIAGFDELEKGVKELGPDFPIKIHHVAEAYNYHLFGGPDEYAQASREWRITQFKQLSKENRRKCQLEDWAACRAAGVGHGLWVGTHVGYNFWLESMRNEKERVTNIMNFIMIQ